MRNEKKVVIVTGGSSGIGRAAAEYLSSLGHTVYSFSRHGATSAAVTNITCDVTNEEQVKSAVAQVVSESGRVDILICAAGFGISGVSETTPLSKAKTQLDVNFFGAVSAVNTVLPYMRRRKNGIIVGISSLASIFAIPFQSFYSASKAAMDSYFSALANEVKPYGIRVTCVRPGDTATGFTAAREKSGGGEEYGERLSKSVSRMEKDEQNGMSAEKVGRFVAKISQKKRPKPFYVPGFGNRVLALLCKILPASVVRFGIGKLYSE